MVREVLVDPTFGLASGRASSSSSASLSLDEAEVDEEDELEEEEEDDDDARVDLLICCDFFSPWRALSASDSSDEESSSLLEEAVESLLLEPELPLLVVLFLPTLVEDDLAFFWLS